MDAPRWSPGNRGQATSLYPFLCLAPLVPLAAHLLGAAARAASGESGESGESGGERERGARSAEARLRFVFDGRRLEGGLAVLDVDSEADLFAARLRHQVITVLDQLLAELLIRETR